MNPENKNKLSLLLSRWKQYSCDAQLRVKRKTGYERKSRRVACTFIFLHKGQPL